MGSYSQTEGKNALSQCESNPFVAQKNAGEPAF